MRDSLFLVTLLSGFSSLFVSCQEVKIFGSCRQVFLYFKRFTIFLIVNRRPGVLFILELSAIPSLSFKSTIVTPKISQVFSSELIINKHKGVPFYQISRKNIFSILDPLKLPYQTILC